jgi:hypothetical protein
MALLFIEKHILVGAETRLESGKRPARQAERSNTRTVTVWDSLKPLKIRWLFQMVVLSQQQEDIVTTTTKR